MCGSSPSPHRRARRLLFAVAWLGGIIATSIGLTGCRRAPIATSEQVLRLSQRNEPADLDPATAGLPDDFFIIRALSEGLLLPSPKGAPRPAAAERFTVSADGLTYTFQLRRDAKWSNGDPVVAADFLSSYQRALEPKTAAPKADLFFAVKNARVFATGKLREFSQVGFSSPDPHTLVVQLEQAMPRFPDLVATGPWIPVHPATVAKFGRDWTRPGNYVGNGPFTLVEWRPQQRIVVRRNPRYHRVNAIRLEEIQFLRFDSGDTEERAYRAGQVDVTMSVPATKLTGYERGRPAEFHRTPLAETHYLSFNTTRPPLNDPRVRRALALAIDREVIVERVLQGGQQAATRMLPPVLRGSDDRGRLPQEFRHDTAEAARLLAVAGFPQGRGFPKLEVTAWSPSQSRVLEAIQEMWRRSLGIEVGLVVHEAKVHLDAMHAGNYDIGFATTLLDWPDGLALLTAFASDSPENLPHWRNAAFDRGLAAARAHGDQPSQDRDTRAAELLLLEDAPVAPVYFNARNWLMSPRVHGWQDDPLWTRFYHDVYLETK